MDNYSQVEEEFSILAEKPIDVVSILTKYLSYWKWFLISLVICITIAALYLSYALPQYKVNTAILFKDDVKGLKEILKTNYKVSKVDELSMENASKIIKDRKEEK